MTQPGQINEEVHLTHGKILFIYFINKKAISRKCYEKAARSDGGYNKSQTFLQRQKGYERSKWECSKVTKASDQDSGDLAAAVYYAIQGMYLLV